MLFISETVSEGSSTLVASGRMWPCSRSIGCEPTVRCRSLAFCVQTVCNNLSISKRTHEAFDPSLVNRPRIDPAAVKSSPTQEGGLTFSREPGVQLFGPDRIWT